MPEDSIVAEVRRIRDEISARHRYDLNKIYQALEEREKRSGRKLVSYPPREPKTVPAVDRDGV